MKELFASTCNWYDLNRKILYKLEFNKPYCVIKFLTYKCNNDYVITSNTEYITYLMQKVNNTNDITIMRKKFSTTGDFVYVNAYSYNSDYKIDMYFGSNNLRKYYSYFSPQCIHLQIYYVPCKFVNVKVYTQYLLFRNIDEAIIYEDEYHEINTKCIFDVSISIDEIKRFNSFRDLMLHISSYYRSYCSKNKLNIKAVELIDIYFDFLDDVIRGVEL